MNATTMTSKTSGRAERRLEDRMQTTTECCPRPFRSFFARQLYTASIRRTYVFAMGEGIGSPVLRSMSI
jgi:hypothetical protein